MPFCSFVAIALDRNRADSTCQRLEKLGLVSDIRVVCPRELKDSLKGIVCSRGLAALKGKHVYMVIPILALASTIYPFATHWKTIQGNLQMTSKRYNHSMFRAEALHLKLRSRSDSRSLMA